MQISSKLPKVGTTIFTVMSQRASERGALNLGQGFPDFDPPQLLRDALTRHMNAGRNQYAPMAGVAPLRVAIARKVEALYGAVIDAEHEVTVTSGATEALFAAIAATIRASDEVIVFDPCYDAYEPAIELAGGRAVHLPLRPGDFSVDWSAVAAAITPRTRMIICNSPHNPSGAVFSEADLAALAQLAERHDLLVLSDEVYEHIVFDEQPHQSVLRHPGLRQRSFVVSSFGKTFSCTGWKLGYCVAPAALAAEFRKVHQYVTFCSFAPAQWALADVLEQAPELYLQLSAFYQARRDRFRALLAGSRFRLLPVPGGFFQCVDYAALSDLDDVAFCDWLLEEAGVAAIPISVFYQAPPREQRIVRLCFAKNDETLARAAEKLCAI
jgi:methionine aminotransferase